MKALPLPFLKAAPCVNGAAESPGYVALGPFFALGDGLEERGEVGVYFVESVH
jgi:hypothetical protein